MNPLARKDSLTVERIQDDTIVYDHTNSAVHCLNRTSTSVWVKCDGRNSVEDIRAKVQEECGGFMDTHALWLALDQLQEARLLDQTAPSAMRPELPGSPDASVSRRELLRKAKVAGILVLVPVVTTVAAPTVAQAGSGGPVTTTTVTSTVANTAITAVVAAAVVANVTTITTNTISSVVVVVLTFFTDIGGRRSPEDLENDRSKYAHLIDRIKQSEGDDRINETIFLLQTLRADPGYYGHVEEDI